MTLKQYEIMRNYRRLRELNDTVHRASEIAARAVCCVAIGGAAVWCLFYWMD